MADAASSLLMVISLADCVYCFVWIHDESTLEHGCFCDGAVNSGSHMDEVDARRGFANRGVKLPIDNVRSFGRQGVVPELACAAQDGEVIAQLPGEVPFEASTRGLVGTRQVENKGMGCRL